MEHKWLFSYNQQTYFQEFWFVLVDYLFEDEMLEQMKIC